MPEVNPLEVLSNLGFSWWLMVLLLGAGLVMSCFVKIATALSILRVGLGGASIPSFILTGGLTLVLTYFVMSPVINESAREVQSVLKEKKGNEIVAVQKGADRWKEFVKKFCYPEQIRSFAKLSKSVDTQVASAPTDSKNVGVDNDLENSWRVLGPAFLVSQLKEAFSIGLRLLLPFLVIDLLVAVLMTALGVQLLSPQLISLPIKLLLFVIVDGWSMIVESLLRGYGG